MGFLFAKQQMGVAALIMGVSILLSRFMGLLRDKVISWQFGATGETDMYFAAFVIPDFLNYLLAGAYVSITLIPLLSKLFSRESAQEQEDAWDFFGTVLLWATFFIVLLSSVAWVFAASLAPLIAPGFNLEEQEQLTSFLRIILPAQIFFLPGACFSAILYIRKQFVIPALMPLIYNGFILLCGILMPFLGLVDGMEGFCYGVLFGAFFGAFFLPYLGVKSGGLLLRLHWYHPDLKYFLVLALPLMLGQSVVILDEQFVRIFGSMAGEGAVSLLSYARRIMMVPVGVVAQAAGVASFPFLASMFARGEKDAFCHNLNMALKNSLIIVLPLTFYMIVVANPTLGFIFEGGMFNESHTLLATPLLQIMLIAVPFWVLQQILGRAFYAMENTLTPALIGTVITFISVPFYYILSPVPTEAATAWYDAFRGMYGVAFITTFSIILYSILMIFWGHKKFGDALKGLAGIFFKNVLINVIPFVSNIYLLKTLSNYFEKTLLSLIWQQLCMLFICGLVYGILYLVLAKIFLPQNIVLLGKPFNRKKRKVRM